MESQAGGTSRVTIKSQQWSVVVSNVTLQVIDRAVSQKKKQKNQQPNNPEAQLSVLVKSSL